MRRLFFCFMLIFCLSTTGCADSSLATSAVDSSSSIEVPSSTSTPSQTSVVRVQLPESQLQDLLKEHKLAYPNPFSPEYPDILTVPAIVHYSMDQLYYCSYEEMPFVGEKYPAAVPEEVCENLYQYDLSTCEKVRIGDVSFSGYSSGEFLFTEDAYYMFASSDEPGKPSLEIKGLNFKSGKLQEIAQIENGLIGGSAAQTDSGTCAFLVQAEDDERKSQKLYTLSTDQELRVIYDSAQIGLEAPEFSALCAGEETLFLLKQTEQEGKLVTEIVEMNPDGTVLKVISLPGLEEYSNPDYYADKLYVAGEYIFIKWYYCGEQLPCFSAFKLVDGKTSEVCVPQNAPCYLLNDKPVNDRYFLFSAFPDGMDYTVNTYTSHLYVLDTMYDRFIGISLPLAKDVIFNDMACNEYGDVIMNIAEKTDAQPTLQARTIRIDFDDLKPLF